MPLREYLRAVVWPREPIATEGAPVKHRYVVVGMLVTDRPLEGLEGQNEIFLDGVSAIAEGLEAMRKWKNVGPRVGDASDLLCSLDRLELELVNE